MLIIAWTVSELSTINYFLLFLVYNEDVLTGKFFMNQQAVLQLSRQILVRQLTREERESLKQLAVARGRSLTAASKASTMRLAQWARNKNSAI